MLFLLKKTYHLLKTRDPMLLLLMVMIDIQLRKKLCSSLMIIIIIEVNKNFVSFLLVVLLLVLKDFLTIFSFNHMIMMMMKLNNFNKKMDTMNEWMDGNLIFTPKNNIIFEQKTVIAFKKIDAINERIIVVVVVITFYVFFCCWHLWLFDFLLFENWFFLFCFFGFIKLIKRGGKCWKTKQTKKGWNFDNHKKHSKMSISG